MSEDAGSWTASAAGGGQSGWRRFAALQPDWAVPGVGAFVTGRAGGVSRGPWGRDGDLPGGLNLGAHCGDDPGDVAVNRARLAAELPSTPLWLRQVHGVNVHVVRASEGPAGRRPEPGSVGAALAVPPEADAAVTDEPGRVLAVLTADCLPVLLADAEGRAVGVAHAGWRGLSAGVLERTLVALRSLLPGGASLRAWLGPAIAQPAFEVGDEVRQAFCAHDPAAALAFAPGLRAGKWQADLYLLARQRLSAAGVDAITGGACCTFADSERFWSYRRRVACGRMASLVWIDG